MNLRQRLEKAIGESPAREVSPDLASRLERVVGPRLAATDSHRGAPVHELLGGEVVESGAGASVVVRRSFALGHRHGSMELSSLFSVSADVLARLGRDPRIAELEVRDLLFLDTETTGLSGGAGTCAFLIGAGFFDGGAFHVRQFFMRDYHEEGAMLAAFRELLCGVKGIVTFNGKTFDVPLIEERFILNRERVALRALPHLDLLFPARRLWRGAFDDCRLGTLEARVLGAPREDDVESRLIPSAYFSFVQRGDATLLPKIFSHNRNDIIALVSLASSLGAAVQDPFGRSGRELVKVGRLHQDSGDPSAARECLEAALDRENEALEDPLPFVRLAIHLEHREKDPERAREVVVRLLASGACRRASLVEDLHRRLERLERKLARRAFTSPGEGEISRSGTAAGKGESPCTS